MFDGVTASGPQGRCRATPPGAPVGNLERLAGQLQQLLAAADVAPTQAQAAMRERLAAPDATLGRWQALRGRAP